MDPSGAQPSPRARLAKAALIKGMRDTVLASALNPFLLASPIVDLGTGKGNPCEHALDSATVEALKDERGLKKGLESIGKGKRWLETLVGRKPSATP